MDEFSPLIGTFCGIGDLPSSVVGTSSELFLEFETAHDGPFLGNGFDLRVGHLPGNADQVYTGVGKRVVPRLRGLTSPRSEEVRSRDSRNLGTIL